MAARAGYHAMAKLKKLQQENKGGHLNQLLEEKKDARFQYFLYSSM